MSAARRPRAPGGGQLPLDLPHRESVAREDFIVTDANRDAFRLVEAWPEWPAPMLLLVGPPGSGKSHLGQIWRQRCGAREIAADTLATADVPELAAAGSLLVEDAPGSRLDEVALFHLINYFREAAAGLLIVSRQYPSAWDLTLPDLRSRLRAAPLVALGAPDDELLRAVLVKLFADRQIAVDAALLDFMLLRMERSLDAARALVDRVDRAALAEKATVSRAFVARLLRREAEIELDFGTDGNHGRGDEDR